MENTAHEKPRATWGSGRGAGIFKNEPFDCTKTRQICNITDRLEGVKQTGPGKWLARCPSHDDWSPSLSIRETEDGRVLIHCFAGCLVEDIVGAIGLELSDLFPQKDGRDFDASAPRAKPPKFRASELLPLVVTEALILAIAWRCVAEGDALTATDKARAELAHQAIMQCWAEVSAP